MSLILSGTDGLSDVDGTAATPAVRGADTNTGIFFPAADTIAFSEGGVESLRLNSSGQIAASTDGTASVPVFTRSTDTNTGFFFPVADTVAASVGGTEGLRLTTTGLGIGKTNPQSILDYRETINVISINTAAVASRTYVLTASLTLTLPATPTAGDWVKVQNSSGTTTAVIGRNGSNIMSLAEDMTVDRTSVSFTLAYADATRGWVFS